jgi:glycosyltransferase involved in cell wall biosynthesis
VLVSPSYDYGPDLDEELARRGASLTADLGRVGVVEPGATLLIHTISTIELPALIGWMKARPATHRPSLVLCFHFDPGGGWAAAYAKKEAQLRLILSEALRELYAMPGVTLTTFSDFLAPLYASEEHRPVIVPTPIDWPMAAETRHRRDRAFVFGFLGRFRAEKGFNLLADALEAACRKEPGIRLLARGAPSTECDAVTARLRTMPAATVATDVAEADDYYQWFDDVDCAVLAYDPVRYRHRISMVGIEAVGFGKPVVTVAGSWLQHVLTEAGAAVIVVPEFSAESLADGLVTAYRERERLKEVAVEAARWARQYHSARNFIAELEAAKGPGAGRLPEKAMSPVG